MKVSRYISVANERETDIFLTIEQPSILHTIVVAMSSTSAGPIAFLTLQKNTNADLKMWHPSCLFKMSLSSDGNEFIVYQPPETIKLSAGDVLHYVIDTSDVAAHKVEGHMTIYLTNIF